jgi:outer membrane receptor for ferrienterochelin and colicin
MTFEGTTTASVAGSALLAALLIGAAVASAQTGPPGARQNPDVSTLDLERLMQVDVVVAGSKRPQNTRDVPSFVSVVTADQIRAHGYRTLGDILSTLPSFYVSNDRNYSYVGVRGFQRPGDYNSRVLLLLNGVRTNDNVYDQAYVDQAFIVDADMINRIEVIRGPSAAPYGNNAFFAVVNVVTKQGRDLNGGEAALHAASFGTYGGRVSYGASVASDADLVLSATYSDSRGQRLYFPEFDAPATNNGFADRADGERFDKLLATMTKGNFSFQASNVSREKHVPTASYGSIFNDARTKTLDGLSLASVDYHRPFAQGASISGRVYGGRSTYFGTYAYAPVVAPNEDSGIGEWLGVEVNATHALWSRQFLTFGAEYRDNFRQNQLNVDPEPRIVYVDARARSRNAGLFAQDDIKVGDGVTLSTGLRYDHHDAFGSVLSPRLGLIYNGGSATTVKLLFGRAFRAPNAYEQDYVSGQSKPNPNLQPERIETLELIAQQRVGASVKLTASAFRNRLSALINENTDPADSLLIFENSQGIHSNGLELGVEVNRGHGLSGQTTYSLQKSEDRQTGAELTNSPRHMIKMQLAAPLLGSALSAAFDAQYTSPLLTLRGLETNASVIANVSLLAAHAGPLALSATIYNLFGSRYRQPGSGEHVEDTIQQDGRSFRVKTTLRF